MRYYKTDITKLSFSEIWAFSANLFAFAILALRKLLGIPFPPRFGVSAGEPVTQVELEKIPERAQAALRKSIGECEALGARLVFCFTVPGIGDREGWAAALLDKEGTSWIGVHWIHVRAGAVSKTGTNCQFASKLSDGTIINTSNTKGRFESSAPGIEPEHRVGAPISALAALHRGRLGRAPGPAVRLDEEGVRDLLEVTRGRIAKTLIARGVWVPMTEAEVARLSGSPRI